MSWVWLDGRFCYEEGFGWAWLKARGIKDGLYETIRLEGSSAPLLRQHLCRILSSKTLPSVSLKEQLSYGRIRPILQRLIQENGLTGRPNLGRLLVYREEGRLVSAVSVNTFAPADKVDLAILTLQQRRGLEGFFREKTFVARLFMDSQTYSLPAFPKAEAVFASPDGTLLEGAHSAILFLKNGKAFIPSLSLPILPSIGRKFAIQMLKAWGIPLIEGRFPASWLFEAGAIYLVNALRGLLPIETVSNTLSVVRSM